MGSSQKRRRHLAEAREAREEAAKERANPVSLATLPCRPPLLVGRCFFQRDDEEVDVWWRWEGTRVGSRPGGKAGKGHRRFVKGLGWAERMEREGGREGSPQGDALHDCSVGSCTDCC